MKHMSCGGFSLSLTDSLNACSWFWWVHDNLKHVQMLKDPLRISNLESRRAFINNLAINRPSLREQLHDGEMTGGRGNMSGAFAALATVVRPYIYVTCTPVCTHVSTRRYVYVDYARYALFALGVTRAICLIIMCNEM